jgi:hypothetical protein
MKMTPVWIPSILRALALPDCWHCARNRVTCRLTRKSPPSIKSVGAQPITGLRDLALNVRLAGSTNVENHTSWRRYAMAPATLRQARGRLGCRDRERLAFRTGRRQPGGNRHEGGYGDRRSRAVPAPSDESGRSALYNKGCGDGRSRRGNYRETCTPQTSIGLATIHRR